jgi:hypothetical protein
VTESTEKAERVMIGSRRGTPEHESILEAMLAHGGILEYQGKWYRVTELAARNDVWWAWYAVVIPAGAG